MRNLLFILAICVSTGALAAPVEDLRSASGLAQAYRAAHKARDCDGVLKLFYTQGATPETIEKIRKNACVDAFRYTVRDIKLNPVDPIFLKQPVIRPDGKKFVSSLPPEGEAEFLYDDIQDNPKLTSQSYVYGRKDGYYFFVAMLEINK